jgi:hypothetical protein
LVSVGFRCAPLIRDEFKLLPRTPTTTYADSTMNHRIDEIFKNKTLVPAKLAAWALTIDVKTLRRLSRRNVIGSVPIGATRRYTREQLLSYIRGEHPCPPTENQAERPVSMTSKSKAIGFTDLLARRANARLTNSRGG